ncbi:MAG TPA: RcnB family protein [Sphingomicrobium sp.]
MRKVLIGLLLAGAAASPALAQDENNHGRWHREAQQQGDRQQAREERQQARQERQEFRQERQEQQQQVREERRSERFDGGNWNRGQAPQFVRERQQVRAQDGERGNWERRSLERRGNISPQVEVEQQAYRNRGPVQVERNRDGGWTRTESYRQRDGSWQQRSGDYRQGQYVQQPYQQRYGDRTRYSGHTWTRDWRNDRRYDWRRYRDSHRSTFRLGLYIDPFGYNYRSFSIGYRLPPVYFGQRYWFDPAIYGLPYPPPGTQWVRYWNDALLVDMYTGEVVDVIQGFFW